MAKPPALPKLEKSATKQSNKHQTSVVSQLNKSAQNMENIHRLMKGIARANCKKSIEIAKAQAVKACTNAVQALKTPVPDIT
eukprot:3220364-Ditylum_brightwellii.AAC.1